MDNRWWFTPFPRPHYRALGRERRWGREWTGRMDEWFGVPPVPAWSRMGWDQKSESNQTCIWPTSRFAHA